MNELVTDSASGPPSPKHRLVTIEIFLTDGAEAWFDWKRHRLPFSTGFSNTHSSGSIAGQPAEIQAKGRRYVALPRDTQEPGFRLRCLAAALLPILVPFVEVARSAPHTHADDGRRPSGE